MDAGIILGRYMPHHWTPCSLSTTYTPAAAAVVALVDMQVGDPTEALALALAKITGNTGMKARSLLTAHDDVTTLHFK